MEKQNTEAAALIRRLKETALKTGFSEAGVIETAGLRFYPEIRAICEKTPAEAIIPNGQNTITYFGALLFCSP